MIGVLSWRPMVCYYFQACMLISKIKYLHKGSIHIHMLIKRVNDIFVPIDFQKVRHFVFKISIVK